MDQGRLARWSPLGGVVFVALLVASGVIFSDEAAPGAADEQILAPDGDGGNRTRIAIAFLPGIVAAPLVLAASLVPLRTGLLPRWVAWAGTLVTLTCFVGVLVGPTLALAWTLVVAILLVLRPAPRASCLERSLDRSRSHAPTKLVL